MILSVRPEQNDALARVHFDDFQSRLLTHLRKHHAKRLSSVSDEHIKAFIRTCCERCKQLYGLNTEQAVVCYTELPLILGDDFETNPAFSTITALLARRSFNPSTRAKMALAFALQVRSRGQ